jgi:hypothetical protein
MICALRGRTVNLVWVKGYEGTLSNAGANAHAGMAAEKPGIFKVMSLAHLKFRISERIRSAKEAWHKTDKYHGKGI